MLDIFYGSCLQMDKRQKLLILFNSGELFTSNINVTYPDGCVETYVNAELVSEECFAGRLMAEEQKKRGMTQRPTQTWSPNLSDIR